MKLELMNHKDVSHVELSKDERYSLGLSIKGGSRGQRPVIKKVKPRSIAERSLSVAKGDVILSINGQDTKWMRGKDARRIIKEVGPILYLNLEYEIRGGCLSRSGIYRKQTMTLKLKKNAHTFGFILRKRESTYPFGMEYPIVSNIIPGGSAHKEGSMKAGDRLLKVDNVTLSWMSLMTIANILRNKGEAEFTIEYNIGVLSASRAQNITELEVDIPDTQDFGVILNSSRRDPSNIYIEDIRPGSMAERCGALCVGDIILSINGVNADLLRVTKANSILYQMKQPLKMAISPFKEPPEIEERTYLGSEANDSNKSTISSSPQNFQNRITFSRSHHNTPVCPRRNLLNFQNELNRDRRHGNSPVRDLSGCSDTRSGHFTDHAFKSNVISNIRHIISNIETLKSSLSEFTTKSFDNAHQKHNNPTEINWELRKAAQEAIQMCALCLTDLNTNCSQAVKSLRHIVLQFTDFIIEGGAQNDGERVVLPCFADLLSLVSPSKVSDIVNTNTIHTLIGNLPDSLADKPKLKELSQSMKDEFKITEASCSKCKTEILSSLVIAVKLLHLVSLNEQTSEATIVRKKLVNEFSRMEVPCADCKNPASNHLADRINKKGAINDTNECLPSTSRTQEPEARAENSAVGHSLEVSKKCNTSSNWKFPKLTFNLREKMAFYKLTDLQSESGTELTYLDDKPNQNFSIEENSVNDVVISDSCENVIEISSKAENVPNLFMNESNNSPPFDKNPCREKNVESSQDRYLRLSPNAPTNFTSDRIQLPKQKIQKIIPKSNYSISREQISTISSNISDRFDNNRELSQNSLSDYSCETDHRILHSTAQDVGKEPRDNRSTKEDSAAARSQSNDLKASPVQIQLGRTIPKNKTHAEIMEVKLKNSGKGFGFVLGIGSTSSSNQLSAPVITSIKPGSPAFEIGILQKGDRVIAMNGRGIVGLPIKDLQDLKSKIFVADKITLTVEFDVVEADLKFGTFKIVLDKTLKAGLEYDGKQTYCPWLVNGILRGSAAHRSGEIFPGDQILFFKCLRKEDFDPLICGFARKEFIEIVVCRELMKVKKNVEAMRHRHVSDEPLSNHKENWRDFVEKSCLKRTKECNAKGRDALVIDQEVTLFKDPLNWDFGFLVGEHPETGQAYVTDIRPGGPAHASGAIEKFDRIVAVNGVPVGKDDDSSVLSLLSQTDCKLQMLIRRICREE